MKIIYIGSHNKGSLKIELGDKIITQHIGEDVKIKNSLICSGYLLAWWFLTSWDSLMNEDEASRDIDWKLSHMMTSTGGGQLWPNLIFIGEGKDILITAKKTDFYINEVEDYRLSKEVFKKEIFKFIENIVSDIERVIRDIDRSTHTYEDWQWEEYDEISIWWSSIKKEEYILRLENFIEELVEKHPSYKDKWNEIKGDSI